MMSKAISEVFDVEPYKRNQREDQEKVELEDDVDYVAKNIRKLIDIGMDSVENAAAVAEDSESPRAYEVVSTMIKNITDMNLQLMDMHSKKKELQRGETGQNVVPGSVTNNAFFVGTTKDLNDIIMKRLNNGTKENE